MLGIRVWDSGLRFWFYIQVWNKIWDSGLGFMFFGFNFAI